jgi:ribonucleoside-diphosphate reductase alpha chain
VELAPARGPFPALPDSVFARAGSPPRRNAQVTSVAPTGTVSLIAGTTAGIEPMFAIAYARNVLGRHLIEVNAHFERLARDRGFYSDELMTDIARAGGVRTNPAVPDDVRTAFPTALEIAPEWHLRIQATVQRHVDTAVSTTINLPASATVDDVRAIYIAAWRAKVKGITIYRYGCRPGQVLTLPVRRRSRRRRGAGAGRRWLRGRLRRARVRVLIARPRCLHRRVTGRATQG